MGMKRLDSRQTDILKGTLDILILQTLAAGAAHGHTIAQVIEHRSEEVLQVEHGSLYPALHRLEDRGYVTSDWKTSDEGRRAKFYRLTPLGRKQFADEQERWKLFSAAVGHTLRAGS